MENQHDTLSTDVATLEEERTELANLMANQPDSDTEEEQEAQAAEAPDHPMGAQSHWVPKAKAKPKPDTEFMDLTRLPQEDIEGLLQCVRKEAKKRKMNDTQSTNNYTQEADYDDDDEEEEPSL